MRTIATHNGTFHVDEALGVWMLRQLPEWAGARVLRSRDAKIHEEADLLLDVGGVYDPAKNRFDHHQRGFTETWSPQHKVVFLPFRALFLMFYPQTKLSSAGLIYRHFGKQVLQVVVGHRQDRELEQLYQRVYLEFVEGIDGHDNGIAPFGSPEEELLPNYKENTHLAARVARLNQSWNDRSDFDANGAFFRAVDLAGADFEWFARDAVASWLPARRIVEEAFENRVHDEILVLSEYCPAMDHLFDLEKRYEVQIKYLIWCDAESARVRAVPLAPTSFLSRLPLPEAWRGLRDAALDSLLHEKGGVFVHANGFIGGHKTLAGAIAMAKQALRRE